MGSAVAAACGGERLWVGEGRSAATFRRAAEVGLVDVDTLASLCERADTVVCICPPDAAVEQARAVHAVGFEGTYVDANAISTAVSRAIGELFDNYVDGSIIGLPPRVGGSTRLYLAGKSAAAVARLWEGSALEVRVLDGEPGAASAVKMCFAAWTKGTGALLLAIRALAEAEGVSDALLAEWETSMPGLITQADNVAAGVGPKAWRFSGEMEQIAATFADAGLPDGFHLAAADIYERMTDLKDQSPAPTLDEVLQTLNSPPQP